MDNSYESRFTAVEYENYGLRKHYRIIPSTTGDRNVGHISPQDALELGVSPENNIGISWMIEMYGRPEIASGYNPSFKDGVPPSDLLSRFVLACVEVEANGLDNIITKNTRAWFELPGEQLTAIIDSLYTKYAKAEVVQNAFSLVREEIAAAPQTTSQFSAASLAIGEVISQPASKKTKFRNLFKKSH